MKKIVVILSCVVVSLVIVTVVYASGISGKATQIRLDEDFQRIESYTQKYFSGLNSIEFNEEDVLVELQEKDGKIEVSVVYFYTAPSVPFKEEVYRWSLGHALNVLSFFPEVSRFDYTVKYPYAEGDVMYLTIDEAKINIKGKNSLESIWFDCSMSEQSGFNTFYKEAFSSIVETEESETWRDQPITDENSSVP